MLKKITLIVLAIAGTAFSQEGVRTKSTQIVNTIFSPKGERIPFRFTLNYNPVNNPNGFESNSVRVGSLNFQDHFCVSGGTKRSIEPGIYFMYYSKSAKKITLAKREAGGKLVHQPSSYLIVDSFSIRPIPSVGQDVPEGKPSHYRMGELYNLNWYFGGKRYVLPFRPGNRSSSEEE